MKAIGYTVDYDLSGNLIDLHKTEDKMNTDRIETVWGFVERYYPDYSRCGDIAENDDLQKILDGEINGESEKIYNEIVEDLKPMFPYHSPKEREEYRMLILEQVQNKLNESNAYIFEKAIQGFIEQQK